MTEEPYEENGGMVWQRGNGTHEVVVPPLGPIVDGPMSPEEIQKMNPDLFAYEQLKKKHGWLYIGHDHTAAVLAVVVVGGTLLGIATAGMSLVFMAVVALPWAVTRFTRTRR